jgi:hypothetical protein
MYHKDPLLYQFMHATPDQVINMWNQIDRELDVAWPTKMNKIVLDCQFTRRIWKVCKLGIGLGAISLLFLLEKKTKHNSSGVPDIYKRFRIMDVYFMYYMYEQYRKYNYNGCRRMVRKKKVYANRHVWSFLSHEKIFVPVHNHANHWVLFVVCPADRQITFIDSLYYQGLWNVMMLDNIVKFIHDYNKSK